MVHNVIIIGTTVGCFFSASCSNYLFHASFFSVQQTFTMSYFRQTILGLVVKMPSWLKISKWGGGVAIRMTWCALFEKINSQGDIYSGLESTEGVLHFSQGWHIIPLSISTPRHTIMHYV